MCHIAEKKAPHNATTQPNEASNTREKQNNLKTSLSGARIMRIIIGVGVIALALWTFVPGIIYPISSNAIVNAQVMTIRAPIQGEVTVILSTEGQAISKGELVAHIKNGRVDRSKLAALMADHTTLHESMLALEQEIKELEVFLIHLKDSGNAYRRSVNKYYQVLTAEKEAKLLARQAIAKDSSSRLARQIALFSKGLTSRAELDAVSRDNAVARAELLTSQREIERVKVELDGAKQGIYFGDGFNNVPYSQQRSDEIALRKQTVVSKLRDANIRTRELARQVDIEKKRLTATGSAELMTPSGGHVWLRLVGEGEHISAGTSMMQIADISRLFLVVSLDERYFEDVSNGDVANVDLIGSTESLNGKVERVQGSQSKLPERMLAVAQPTLNKNDFLVFVKLDTSGFKSDSEIFNQIGRRAKVTFHKNNSPSPSLNQILLLFDELGQKDES